MQRVVVGYLTHSLYDPSHPAKLLPRARPYWKDFHAARLAARSQVEAVFAHASAGILPVHAWLTRSRVGQAKRSHWRVVQQAAQLLGGSDPKQRH